MAAGEVVLETSSRYLDQDSCENGKNSCVNCLRMKDYLKVIITELQSAQLIYKILHEEIKPQAGQSMGTGNVSNCVGCNAHGKSIGQNEWNEIQCNNHESRKSIGTSDCKGQLDSDFPLTCNYSVFQGGRSRPRGW